ncbi:MAG: hypothetical protein M3M99_04455 [Actinomycetota bacterium]|nr:hypothetical protein [Actinomycetota bacterium]
MDRTAHLSARLHRLAVAFACAIFAVALAIGIGTGTASAAQKLTVLGAAAPATPSCPDNCQAIGKTTGFQTSIGKIKSPFVAPETGRLVAWSIKLGAPTQKQQEFFVDFFGGAPQARISVLKPINKQIRLGRQLYKLKSQGPVEDLMPFLGTTTTFTLQQPLVVRAGQVVALTVPTWAPAFAVNLPSNTAWRASRKQTKCTNADDIKLGSSHQLAGQDRLYGCVYKTARLLFSASIVADPAAVKPKPPTKKPAS